MNSRTEPPKKEHGVEVFHSGKPLTASATDDVLGRIREERDLANLGQSAGQSRDRSDITPNDVSISSRQTPMDDKYATCERTCAKLLIYCGAMHPSAVSDLLGMEPTSHVALGEPGRTNRLGKAPIGKLNGWFLSSEGNVESKDVRHHLEWLIAKLRPNSEVLHELQAKPDVRMSVNCIWWSRYGDGGPTLWPEQMRALADLNLECSFAFADYSDDTDGTDDSA
jgi:hypothetical protein